VDTKTAGEPRPRWAEIAYEAIAPVYDEFTHRNDYETWFGLLVPALERHGLRHGRLLDVGCGSGKSFPPMLERGWEIVGCDVSPAMLERARAKVGDSVRLEVADMRALPVFGEFDLVWALNDPVNYLLDEEELALAFAGMRRNLAPGGLLLFDTNTLHAYRSFFAEDVVIERDGWRLVWNGHGRPDSEPGTVSEASFEATPLEEGVGTAIAPELHRERHFPPEQILAGLARAGLECVEHCGYGDDEQMHQPLDEAEHSKAIYIARAAWSPTL
jgi:SAM-dependent methyltransferase